MLGIFSLHCVSRKTGRDLIRNAMISLLAEMIREATVENIDIICYLVLGRISAGYKDIQLGVDDEMVKSAIALAADIDEQKVNEEFRATGDLGEVAYRLIGDKRRRFNGFFEFGGTFSVETVHNGLSKIASASGSGSQEEKIKVLAAMLAGSSTRERRYLVRLSTGEMRLGADSKETGTLQSHREASSGGSFDGH